MAGLRRYGLNVAASRLTSGNHLLYAKFEKQLARFFRAESALVTPTGYVANLVVGQALAGQFSHVLIDEAAHPSLQDTALAMDCPIVKFRHRSVSEMQSALARCGSGCKPILLTDGMFSRDGATAPLGDYQTALPRDAVLLVDDAHGAGVLGKFGRGSIEHEGISRRHVIQTITLSKAFGVYGGAILGSAALKKRLLSRSRLFVGSTPLPLPMVSAAEQALEIVSRDTSLRSRLATHTARVRERLGAAGLRVPQAPGPIIALEPKRVSDAVKVKRTLLQSGIYPPFIVYPGGPKSGYFRFVISSEHTRAQLDLLTNSLLKSARLLVPLRSNAIEPAT